MMFLTVPRLFQVFLLLLPLLPASHRGLPRIPPLRGERQVGSERGRSQAVAAHHLHPAHLVLLRPLCRPHGILLRGE